MKKVTGFLCLLELGVFCAGAWAKTADERVKALTVQAEGGNVSAQTQLGIIYAKGDSVTRDFQISE